MQLTYRLNVSCQEEDIDPGEAEDRWDVDGERKRQDAMELNIMLRVVWEATLNAREGSVHECSRKHCL